jgi:DNA-binding response OmpR family regulator
MPELLGIPPEKVYDERLYRALDKLLPHKKALEKHLKNRLGSMFGLNYDLLLYDVTSTYFEGQCQGNPMAQRGYSRDKRSDCKQICIGLVVSKCGMPLGYEVFEGNRNDVKTWQEIVTKMEACYGKADRIWCGDRGMMSKENLEFRQYSCETAADASEARHYLNTFEFHLVISDIKMPGESGLDLVRFALSEYPDLAAIILTGINDFNLVKSAIDTGIYDYITKPIDQNRVIISVANALHRRMLKIENQNHRLELEKLVEKRTTALKQAISDLEKSQKDLRKNEHNFRSFLDTSKDAVYMVTTDQTPSYKQSSCQGAIHTWSESPIQN